MNIRCAGRVRATCDYHFTHHPTRMEALLHVHVRVSWLRANTRFSLRLGGGAAINKDKERERAVKKV
jgi:hypothetical protein